jgi:hypothetical protein
VRCHHHNSVGKADELLLNTRHVDVIMEEEFKADRACKFLDQALNRHKIRIGTTAVLPADEYHDSSRSIQELHTAEQAIEAQRGHNAKQVLGYGLHGHDCMPRSRSPAPKQRGQVKRRFDIALSPGRARISELCLPSRHASRSPWPAARPMQKR